MFNQAPPVPPQACLPEGSSLTGAFSDAAPVASSMGMPHPPPPPPLVLTADILAATAAAGRHPSEHWVCNVCGNLNRASRGKCNMNVCGAVFGFPGPYKWVTPAQTTTRPAPPSAAAFTYAPPTSTSPVCEGWPASASQHMFESAPLAPPPPPPLTPVGYNIAPSTTQAAAAAAPAASTAIPVMVKQCLSSSSSVNVASASANEKGTGRPQYRQKPQAPSSASSASADVSKKTSLTSSMLSEMANMDHTTTSPVPFAKPSAATTVPVPVPGHAHHGVPTSSMPAMMPMPVPYPYMMMQPPHMVYMVPQHHQ